MPRLRILFVLLVAAPVARADDLRTLSGKNVSGKLQRIDADAIVIETDGGAVSTPLSQALLLDLRPARVVPGSVKYSEVRLLDDTELRATQVRYSGKEVELTLLSGETLKLPLATVASVLRDAHDPGIRKQFRNALQGKARSDRIVIFKDGELNTIEGTLGEVAADGKSIEFKRDGSAPIKARFDLLHGLVFLRTDVPADSAICKVIDQEGDTLMASKLRYDGATLTVTTPAGLSLPLKGEVLARLDFNLGRLTYLSDLEPTKLNDSPFFGGFLTFRKDVNQDGRPIVLLDKSFSKGITLEGGDAVEYNLGGKYKDFKAYLGADVRSAEGALGKTTVTIYCDGQKRLSETVSPAELRPIAVNVKDVTTLRIVVEGPNFTGLSAYATLADARISQ